MCAVDTKAEIVVALAGNPNSGKTTVFNEMTGARQHVGNWPGVTVERKEGVVKKFGRTFRIVDLPGTYSLSAYSQEEVIARDFLLENHVDVIVNVVDASNLERNLYLTTQLLELGISTVISLNMIDMAERRGKWINLEKLAQLTGVAVVPTVGHRGEGIDAILQKVIELADCGLCESPRSARHNPEIEIEVSNLHQRLQIKQDCAVPVRWMLIKALEGDAEARRRLAVYAVDGEDALQEVDNTRRHLEQHFGDELEAVIAGGRYGFIGGLLREVVTHTGSVDRMTMTDKIDSILLHRVLGLPIFLALMWFTFMLTFDVGGMFANWLDAGVTSLSSWIAGALPPGPISSLLTHGVIAGVGGVVVFMPNIVVMFIIISFLEGSGYMARAAFLMDRTMHVLGLHGKSFIPMLMGFGCNVPAVMAARTLETPEDRLLTILITPLMSCTARLPIYILFTGVFFSRNGAMIIFSIYALGVLLAVVSGKLFRKVLFPKSVSPFVMELPPYRLPTLKGTIIHVWERTSLFLSKAGTVVLAASVIIWALGSLPWGVQFGGPQSLIGHLGRAAEPLVRPLGLDWRAAVALFFGLGAKEIVVSTLGVLLGSGHSGGSVGLQKSVAAAFTPLSAFTFMVLSLIYIPCIATIATIKRETNSWKWTAFAVGYSLTLAYAVAFMVYRFGLLAGFK
ncbi:MAG: ferrous iron transport protein B [Armatimonadota bacterium]|nr:ferrous iron transport protein B [bacterium]